MNNKIAKPLVALAAIAALGAGAALSAVASADTTQSSGTTNGSAMPHMGRMHDGVFGTITAIRGNTITVAGQNNTSYTVDTTNAKILKASSTSAPATVSVSSLTIGDNVGVRGTVNGTSVAATEIMDGMGFGNKGMGGGHGRGPGTMGTVTSVSGNTVTITGANGTTYTVDAGSAKVSKVVDLSVSDIKVGDTIGVEGTVNGTSITANHIMDGVPPKGNAPPAQQN